MLRTAAAARQRMAAARAYREAYDAMHAAGFTRSYDFRPWGIEVPEVKRWNRVQSCAAVLLREDARPFEDGLATASRILSGG